VSYENYVCLVDYCSIMTDYIFGYGSIINDASRLGSLRSLDGDASRNHPAVAIPNNPSQSSEVSALITPPGLHPLQGRDRTVSSGQIASQPAGFGGSSEDDTAFAARVNIGAMNLRRAWCFRSKSGFTAVGLEPREVAASAACGKNGNEIFGVLFPVGSPAALAVFDSREAGYDRIAVPLEYINADVAMGHENARRRALAFRSIVAASSGLINVWMYVPKRDVCMPPDEEHPIIQTYIDVCLRGCLQWGGSTLVSEFIATTCGWTKYFLNDTPTSRRPWLHRPDYGVIDKCLEELSDWCMYTHRKHPEEFAADHLSPLRGMWGVPPRDRDFVGRELYMSAIHSKLMEPRSGDPKNVSVSSRFHRQVQIVGLGGVGKTHLAVEYCHRHFNTSFSLVLWLRSSNRETIAADIRRFAVDVAITKAKADKEGDANTKDSSDDYILEEIRRRLARSRSRWLVVFENLEDAAVIEEYLSFLQPDTTWNSRSSMSSNDSSVFGSQTGGYVLCTSRIVHKIWSDAGTFIELECFNDCESAAYLSKTLGDSDMVDLRNRTKPDSVQSNFLRLAARMDHLPLALSMAVAYMKRCDVGVDEYLERLDSWGRVQTEFSDNNLNGISGVNTSIVTSLSISLQRISIESNHAAKVLPCIGLLYPDGITKLLVGAILSFSLEAAHSSKLKTSVLQGWTKYFVFDKAGVFYTLKRLMFPKLKKPRRIFVIFIPLMIALIKAKAYNAIVLSCLIFLCVLVVKFLYACSMFDEKVVFDRLGLRWQRDQKGSAHGISEACERIGRTEVVAAEIDNLWDLMIQFSIVSVRGTRNVQRTGSVHRLLQSVLRSQRSPSQLAMSLETTILACASLWKFDRNNPDFTGWDSCGNLVSHIETVGAFAISFMSIPPHNIRDIEASISNNTLDSSSVENKSYLEYVISGWISLHNELLELLWPSNSSENQDDTKVQVFEAHALRWNYLLQLSLLLVEASQYSSIVQSKFDTALLFLQLAVDINAYLLQAWVSAPDLLRRCTPNSELIRLRRSLSSSLHHFGVALRYTGSFDKAIEVFKVALHLREMESNFSSDIADTLHQLGVVSLKMRNLNDAEVLLKRALGLKRRIKATSDGVSVVDSSEASTLHQLGVVARAQKRFDEAHDIFERALAANDFEALVSQKRTGITSVKYVVNKASSLQQIGRILLRKGQVEEAKVLFIEALRLYERCYGDQYSTNHVNMIAVRHQLGAACVASRDNEGAKVHYAAAVCGLEALYGDSSNVWRKYDIVFELQSYGQVLLACGDVSEAKEVFTRCESIIFEILEKGSGNRPNPFRSFNDEDSNLESPGPDSLFSDVVQRRQSLLLKALLFAIHCLRNIMKLQDRLDRAASYTKQAIEIRKMQKSPNSLRQDSILRLLQVLRAIDSGGTEEEHSKSRNTSSKMDLSSSSAPFASRTVIKSQVKRHKNSVFYCEVAVDESFPEIFGMGILVLISELINARISVRHQCAVVRQGKHLEDGGDFSFQQALEERFQVIEINLATVRDYLLRAEHIASQRSALARLDNLEIGINLFFFTVRSALKPPPQAQPCDDTRRDNDSTSGERSTRCMSEWFRACDELRASMLQFDLRLEDRAPN
jgi:tetratricopeptide (TPR) repeat protein/GTPase SAR1 family protein